VGAHEGAEVSERETDLFGAQLSPKREYDDAQPSERMPLFTPAPAPMPGQIELAPNVCPGCGATDCTPATCPAYEASPTAT
jgi:hypothetical protein